MTITQPCPCGTLVEIERPDPDSFAASILANCGVVCVSCAERAREEVTSEQRALAEQARMTAISRRRGASQVPDALTGRVWGDLKNLDGGVLEALRSWADGKIKGLLLMGPVGAGKTYSAATAAWAMLERRPLIWTSAPLLFARLGSGLGSPARDRAVEILTSRKALVLDDLDKARPTEYGAEQIFLAVDNRVSNGVSLLATTNLSLAEISQRFPEPYGEAIASRLAGYCEVRKIEGRDRRLDAAS